MTYPGEQMNENKNDSSKINSQGSGGRRGGGEEEGGVRGVWLMAEVSTVVGGRTTPGV